MTATCHRLAVRDVRQIPDHYEARDDADLHATVCQALGISLDKEIHTHDGRPMRLVRKDGQPIRELFV